MMGNGASAHNSQPFRNPLFLITYLPPKTTGLVYSDKLGVYTNDLARAESLPSPHSPPTRQCEIFDPEVFKEVDEKTDTFLDADTNGPINEFVQQLTGCYDDDLSKVRALYRWCTSQPIMVTHYDNSSFQTMAYQLWNLQQGRTSYAFLFHMLCCLSGIPCVIINGFIKGASYKIGQRMTRDKHMGEWNAVLIGEHWRLIDTFWGASVVPGDTDDSAQSSSYMSEENYFLPNPEQYIYAHFPMLSDWQLLGDDQKTLHEFETMAVLNDRFFDFKMELLSHVSSTIDTESREVKVIFGLDPSDSLNQMFFCVPSIIKDKSVSEDQGDLSNNNAWLTVNDTTKGRVLEVNARFSGPGIYRLDIVGKDRTNKTPGYNYDWVAVYRVNVKPVSANETLVDSPGNLESVSFEPCKSFPEFGLVAFDHPDDVTEMTPGILQLRYRISDAEKLGNACVSIALMREIGDGLVSGSHSSNPVDVVPFVKEGKELSAEVKISEGQFGIRFIYGNSTGKGLLLCIHKIVCVPSPKQDMKKDQHYTAIQTDGNETQSTQVENTGCEQKYTCPGKKPVKNKDKKTRAIAKKLFLEPGDIERKSEIKTVAVSQAIPEHTASPTQTENIATVHSINEDTTFLTELQPEATVIEVRMPTDANETISEARRSEASHIHELKQNSDEETVKTESKFNEKEGNLLVETSKEIPEHTEIKPKVHKRLKTKSESNQHRKEQKKYKSGQFQDGNSRLKSKMNQNRNNNMPNEKEDKPFRAPKQDVKEVQLLDTPVCQKALSEISKDQHYTAIQTGGNEAQLTPVENTECEQKYTYPGKKPVKNKDKKTRAIDTNVILEPGGKERKSEIKSVAVSQAIPEHTASPTQTENIASVHSINEDTTFLTQLQAEATVVEGRMPTDADETISEVRRSEASHIHELKQNSDEETVKTVSKFNETDGNLLVETSKENPEHTEIKPKVHKRLKTKSESNQHRKEQKKYKSGQFQDGNSRLKPKMNQDRNNNIPNEKEDKLVRAPKQDVKEAQLLDTSVCQKTVSEISKDQHYTAIQTGGNEAQLTPVENTECEQKYTYPGKKPVKNKDKKTRAIYKNVLLEPGGKESKSEIKTVAVSQAIPEHTASTTQTENIASVHSINEDTTFFTKLQPEATVIEVRMPTDSAETISEDRRSEASHIHELKQNSDEETVKTVSKFNETEGNLLVETSKENPEHTEIKPKVHKRLKTKSESNQHRKDQKKYKSGQFQDGNSRLKSKMNQDRNSNIPNEKEDKPVRAKRVVVKPKKKRKEKAVHIPKDTDESSTTDISLHITHHPEYRTNIVNISKAQPINTDEGEKELPNVDIEELRTKLVAAIDNQHIGELYSVVKEAATSGHVTRLEPEFTDARETLLKLRRVLKLTQKVMGLNQRALSEIRSYIHPIPEIQRVMQAALLLMGHGEDETREWSDIRLVIGKSGKSSLQRRIRRLRVGDIGPGVIERSRCLLQGLNHDDLGRYSVGVAALYSWAVEVSEGTNYKRFRKIRK